MPSYPSICAVVQAHAELSGVSSIGVHSPPSDVALNDRGVLLTSLPRQTSPAPTYGSGCALGAGEVGAGVGSTVGIPAPHTPRSVKSAS